MGPSLHGPSVSRNLANSTKSPESPESPESCELTKSPRAPTLFHRKLLCDEPRTRPQSPRKRGAVGVGLRGPSLLYGQGSKRFPPAPLTVYHAHPPYTPACIPAPHKRTPRM
eukprot:73540-Prymnesium_polylepis.1